MKAVILCGGKGTRISEETRNIPKPMVKIGKYPIILHRGGEPWGLPLIQSGKVENLAEIHSPYDKKISMEQWNNNSVMNFDKGILELNNYLGFGSEPKEIIFNE